MSDAADPDFDVARDALTRYRFETVRVRLHSRSENSTYQVEDAAGGKYALRVQRPGRDPAEIRSEARWLAAISRDTDLLVPEPVLTAEGQLTVTVADAAGAERCCALFRWLDGELVGEPLSAADVGEIGTVMARLHEHAATFDRGPGFVRGHLGAEAFVPARFPAGLPRSPLLTESDVDLCRTAFGIVYERLVQLGSGPEVFGLIHADLHGYNCLRVAGRLAPIDFDDCTMGYLGYDMAVTLGMADERANGPDLRAAFLDGYRSVRPIEPRTAAMLDTFVAARRIHLLAWISDNFTDLPWLAEWATTFVPGSLSFLRDFVAEAQPRPT